MGQSPPRNLATPHSVLLVTCFFGPGGLCGVPVCKMVLCCNNEMVDTLCVYIRLSQLGCVQGNRRSSNCSFPEFASYKSSAECNFSVSLQTGNKDPSL